MLFASFANKEFESNQHRFVMTYPWYNKPSIILPNINLAKSCLTPQTDCPAKITCPYYVLIELQVRNILIQYNHARKIWERVIGARRRVVNDPGYGQLVRPRRLLRGACAQTRCRERCVLRAEKIIMTSLV